MEILSWIFAGLALLGTVLNTRQNKYCFILWGFSNAFWVIYNFQKESFAQSFLFTVYVGLAVYGWKNWSKK